MKSLNIDIVNTLRDDSDKISNSENFNSETIDPLLDFSDETTEHYKVDSIVFAEPLKNNLNADSQADKEEIIFIDNVIVQKREDKKYKKYHINVEDITNLKCPQPNCNRTFSSTKLLKVHIRKVHCADRSKYMCERCGAGFPAQYLLVRHSVVHSGKKMQCPVCSIMLSCRTSLSTHLRTHSGVRPHSCNICKKSFTRSSTLATHIKFVHSPALKCDQCDASFSSRKLWSQHMANHRRKINIETDTS